MKCQQNRIELVTRPGDGQARRDTEGLHPQLPPLQPLLLKPPHSILGQAHQRHLRGVCYLNREMASLAGFLHHVHVYLQVRKKFSDDNQMGKIFQKAQVT